MQASSFAISAKAFVRVDGCALFGVSGHKLDVLPENAVVKTFDAFGPYTQVSYRGRMGLVLTEHLRWEIDKANTRILAAVATKEPEVRRRPRVPSFMLALIFAGGSAASILSFLLGS